MPEKDLVGCWPLWPQFGPDELEFRCVRRWTSDPGEQAPHKYMQGRAPLPCWRRGPEPPPARPPPRDASAAGATRGDRRRTCWTPLKSPGAERCTAACPSAESVRAGRRVKGTRPSHASTTRPRHAPQAEPAVEWRARWDAELHSFKERDGTARDVERATGFIRRLPNSDFFWSVY